MNIYRNTELKNNLFFIKIQIGIIMKFNLLSIGQKFKYQDEVYVKTSPIVASNVASGHNKMIPAYAVLTLLDNSGEEEKILSNESIAVNNVHAAFNTFYEQCIKTLESNNVLVPIIKNELDKARDKFTQQLMKNTYSS